MHSVGMLCERSELPQVLHATQAAVLITPPCERPWVQSITTVLIVCYSCQLILAIEQISLLHDEFRELFPLHVTITIHIDILEQLIHYIRELFFCECWASNRCLCRQ